MDHEEYQYLNLIQTVIDKGTQEIGRNGSTISYFGNMMRFSLENNTIPILTTKKLAWKTCFKELMFFLRGETDNKLLKKENVKIWNMNGSREFLDSRGLTDREEDDLGPIYGFQWRHWNAMYSDCHTNYDNCGIDQMQNIIDTLKNPATRTSRRMILSAWNPEQIDSMALPPCHVLAQFHVSNGNRLHCALFQRSGDIGLGVPFKIASYSFLTHLIAHVTGLIPYEFVYFLGNAHIYQEHLLTLQNVQLNCIPKPFPKIKILSEPKNIDEYNINDILIENYEHYPTIPMSMSA